MTRCDVIHSYRSVFTAAWSTGAGGIFEGNDNPVPDGYYRVYVGLYVSHTDAAREMEFRVVRLGTGVTTTITGSLSQGNGAARTRLWWPEPVFLYERENIRVQVQATAAAQTVNASFVYYELPMTMPIPFLP